MNTITKFYGNGCMNCKALAPIFESVKGEYSNITFKEVNTSTDMEIGEKYGVTSLPTLLFEKDGKEVGRLIGLKPKSLIVKKIAEVF
jgi:thioredoxin 1